MTDEERIAALFRAAASEDAAPPAAFDHADVVGASRRITARRRSALVGGVVALVAVAGIGAAVTLPPNGPGEASTAAAPAAPEAARAGQDAGGEAGDVAGGAARPDALSAVPAPLGPGDPECADRQDPALRALLERALPEVTGAPEAAITLECRPGGERGVNLEVVDAGAAGVLSVEYLPPGAPARPPEPDVAVASAPTASGGTVVVRSRGAEPGAVPPFAGRVEAVAADLAPRL